jgi:hypothetical protein
MARLILLDNGPLVLMVRAPGKPQVQRFLAWLNAVMTNGAVVVIPEIAHYEVRRELIRIRAVGSLQRLEYALDPSSGFDHLTLTTDAVVKAAELRAERTCTAIRRSAAAGIGRSLDADRKQARTSDTAKPIHGRPSATFRQSSI